MKRVTINGATVHVYDAAEVDKADLRQRVVDIGNGYYILPLRVRDAAQIVLGEDAVYDVLPQAYADTLPLSKRALTVWSYDDNSVFGEPRDISSYKHVLCGIAKDAPESPLD